MPDDKKYGFEEVDKLASKEVRLKPLQWIYIIFFSLCYFYISISIIGYFDSIDLYYQILWIMCIYGIILTFIIGGFYKSLAKTVKSKKYAAMMDEKSVLEEKFKKVLDKNPITVEDYVKAFLLVYEDYYKYRQYGIEFQRLLYLRKIITYEQFNNDKELAELIYLIKENDRIKEKFKKVLNENPQAPIDYLRVFFHIYGNNYLEHLDDFIRLLYLQEKLTSTDPQKVIDSIEKRHASMFLDIMFEKMLSNNSTSFKHYVGKFMSVYGFNYAENLQRFKSMMSSKKKSSPIEIENEIISYFKSIISNKSSFKSIYGFEPVYDLKLIHDFAKKYGTSYSEDDLENLNRLLVTKGIKIHNKAILKELVSEASFEYEYGRFTECMKTETPLDEMGYIKETINLFGNDIDYELPFLHRFFIQHNLTSLDYKSFEEHIKTKIFELNLLSSEKQLLIHDIDGMSGYEFEAFVGQLYEKMGYSVEQTPLSNDQGADLIISKYGEKTAVQVKNYTSNVPNSAVQQVVAAKNYYGCSSCSVVTNSYFTKSAIELADANGVKLVDRDELNYLINNKAIKIDQKSDRAWYVKGCELSSLGREEEAMQAFDKAIEINPRSASIWNSKGLALSSLGRYEEAIQAFDKVIEIDSKYPRAWDNKGLALSSLRREEEAIQAYDKAIEIDPKFEGPWGSKGWALSSLGRYEEAIQAFDKSIEIKPRSASIWNSKGLALSILGRYEEAIQAFDKAIEIDPKFEIPWSSKGWALSSLGRYEEAIQAFDKAIEIDSQYGSAWGGKSLALSSLGREEEANEAFDRAKELGYTES